jgi:hypothetical protein
MSASYSPILRQCADIADEREAQYGDVSKNFDDISAICKTAFGLTLSPTQIMQVMVAVKLSRNLHKPKADNLLDAINYLAMQLPTTQK